MRIAVIFAAGLWAFVLLINILTPSAFGQEVSPAPSEETILSTGDAINPCQNYNGQSNGGWICCPNSCGACGGDQCGEGDDVEDCCSHRIALKGVTCGHGDAPCVLPWAGDIEIILAKGQIALQARDPSHKVRCKGDLHLAVRETHTIFFGRSPLSDSFDWNSAQFIKVDRAGAICEVISEEDCASGSGFTKFGEGPFSLKKTSDGNSLALIDDPGESESEFCYAIRLKGALGFFCSDPKIYNEDPGDPTDTRD